MIMTHPLPSTTTAPPVSLAKYLHQAIRDDAHPLIDSLLVQGADPNEFDDEGMTAMHIAAQKGDILALIKLKNAGGDVDVQHKVSKSRPIHFAAEVGSKDSVGFLVEAGADIDAVNDYNVTPLIYACLGNHETLVRFLVRHNADTEHRLKWGATARAISVLKGHHKCTKLLPSDPYSEEFIRRKTLAHFNGIADKTELDGTEFDLTGAFSPYMHEQISQTLFTYFKENDAPFSQVAEKKLTTAFLRASRPRSTSQIISEVQKGRLVILPSQWIRHAIDLVFFKIGENYYYAVCNRGEGIPQHHTTIEVYCINPTNFDEAIVALIEKQRGKPMLEASTMFYFTLPTALSKGIGVARDQFCTDMRKYAPSQIKIGICSLGCGKAALRLVGIVLKASARVKNPASKYGRVITEFTKLWSDHARFEKAEEYSESPSPDKKLLKRSAEKILERRKKHRYSPLNDAKRRKVNVDQFLTDHMDTAKS
jgi:hypothetical protein